jgi:arylsulfatase A-like enzyme
MRRRTVLKLAAQALPGLSLPAGDAPLQISSKRLSSKRRPNVLFILPDEWRTQALGCMGNPDVATPHLDRLASQGTLFRNTLANTPVCCPARANILTGTYTSRNRMIANDLRLRESAQTVAHLFAGAGYRTGFIGKWHLDGGPRLPGFVPPGPRRHGFTYWAANECNHNYFYSWYFRDENVPITTEQYEPEFWTDLAIEFLYETQDRPFFLMLAMGTPHDPYLAPKQYMDRYDPQRLQMRDNWVEGVRGGSRQDIAGYYAAITATDEQIGRVLRALEQLQLDRNTIVLFSSDHGNMLGSQGKILKRKPWEESIRVPGILRWPGIIPAGRTSDTLFSHVDFAPTLLSLCGIPVPKDMQGADLSRLARGESQAAPQEAFFQIFGPYQAGGVEHGWRAIRTERYLYARYAAGPWLLYDLENDPDELRNLVNDTSQRSVLDDLDRKLTRWMNQTGDSWELNWESPVEDDGRLYTYRTFYTVDEYLAWAKQNPELAKGLR